MLALPQLPPLSRAAHSIRTNGEKRVAPIQVPPSFVAALHSTGRMVVLRLVQFSLPLPYRSPPSTSPDKAASTACPSGISALQSETARESPPLPERLGGFSFKILFEEDVALIDPPT